MPAPAADPAMARPPATLLRYSSALPAVAAPATIADTTRIGRIFQPVRISRFPACSKARSGPLAGPFAYNGRSVAETGNLNDVAAWMRRDWNRRALEDADRFVYTRDSESDEEDFNKS